MQENAFRARLKGVREMEKRTLPYWNHNAAYYPWIARQVGSRSLFSFRRGFHFFF